MVAMSMSGGQSFLSTPSARRATIYCKRLNPDTCISIHALREEGDSHTAVGWHNAKLFLSTPSARRATNADYYLALADVISIHALREEGDLFFTGHDIILWNFYPRPPRGGRRWAIYCRSLGLSISIHALREEGDPSAAYSATWMLISIHALREEGDAGAAGVLPHAKNFYPRPPRGGRRAAQRRRMERTAFLSTPSARRATMPCRPCTARP